MIKTKVEYKDSHRYTLKLCGFVFRELERFAILIALIKALQPAVTCKIPVPVTEFRQRTPIHNTKRAYNTCTAYVHIRTVHVLSVRYTYDT